MFSVCCHEAAAHDVSRESSCRTAAKSDPRGRDQLGDDGTGQ
jgi:hypothetical protein